MLSNTKPADAGFAAHADGSPRYAIQFPSTGYYRDMRFCDHRNTGLGSETDPEIPDGNVAFCGNLNESQNRGFGIDEDGNASSNTTASNCFSSSTCYADRRDWGEPALNPNTPPIRYSIRELPEPQPPAP